MATVTGTASSRRNYWQLPLFVLGVCAMAASWQYFPLKPLSATERFMKELAQLEKAIDRRPIDIGRLEELAPQVADAAKDYPEHVESAHNFAGQAYILLARNEPMNRDYWKAAETEFQQLKADDRPAYSLAMAQAAIGEVEPKSLVDALMKYPNPNEMEGERRRLLADTYLRMDPPYHPGAQDELAAYLSGSHRLPPEGLAEYRLRLAKSYVATRNPDEAERWLTDIGPGAPSNIVTEAELLRAELALADNDYADVVMQLESALTTLPADDERTSTTEYKLANALLKMRQPDRAREHFTNALNQSGPSANAARAELAQLNLTGNVEQRQRAVTLLKELAETFETDTKWTNAFIGKPAVIAVYEQAIDTTLRENEYDSAAVLVDAYAPLVAEDRNRQKHAEVQSAWGKFLGDKPDAQKKFQAAAKDYEALAKNTKDAKVRTTLLRQAADAYRQAGDSKMSLSIEDKLIDAKGSTEANVASAWLNKGRAMLKNGEFEDGIVALQKVIDLESASSMTARYELAEAHMKEARTLALSDKPDDQRQAEGYQKFAKQLYSQVANTTSETDADRLARQESLYQLGIIAWRSEGNLAEAEARFRQLNTSRPAGLLGDKGAMQWGSSLLELAKGTETRPATDATLKREQALSLFAKLRKSEDPMISTTAKIIYIDTKLKMQKYDEVPDLAETLMKEFEGKVEGLCVLSILYWSYRDSDRPELASETYSRLVDYYKSLDGTAFRGGSREYTREYWYDEWVNITEQGK